MKKMVVGWKFRERLCGKDLLLPSVLSVVLFAMAIWGIGEFNQLLIYPDEFGYWTASAYLTGDDWRPVTGGILYYSYGYGFSILTLIRLLFDSPRRMYQAAIVVNALLLVWSYWIARSVTREIFESAHRTFLDVVCFLAIVYPSNLVFSHIAWSECTLVFVFWIFVWLSLVVMKRPSVWNHAALAAVSVGIFMIHQRTVSVLISTGIMMAWLFFTDKSRRKEILVFASTAAVLILFHSLVKENLFQDFYNNSSNVMVNNFEGQTEKLKRILTGEGLRDLLYSMAGKGFYLFVSTFMMAWWSAQALFRSAGSCLKSLSFHGKLQSIPLWHIWLLLAFAGNFMVASIFMMGFTGSNDYLLYGRYTEYMIGIYFVIGIMEFLKDQDWLQKALACAAAALCCGILCQRLLDADNAVKYVAYNSVCTSLFLEADASASRAALVYAFFGISVSLCMMLLVKRQLWKKPDWVRYGMAALLVFLLYGGISFRLVLGRITERQQIHNSITGDIADWIGQMDGDAKQKVYYCIDTTKIRAWSQGFQFLLQKTPVTYIKTEEIDPEEDAFYIVGKSYVQSDDFEERYFCIGQTNLYALIVNKDGGLAKKAQELWGSSD